MIAYVLEDVGPQAAAADKRMERLRGAGPWQYQLHPRGCFATWRNPLGPVPLASFGAERKTVDGMVYLGPKVLPMPEELLRESMRQRDDLTDVIASEESGITVRVVPAYRTPRRIMEDNSVGDFTTMYGRAVWALMARISERPDITVGEVSGDMLDCCRLALMHSYRLTSELLADLGWIHEDNFRAIWEAAIQVPKETPAAEGGN